MRHKIAIGVWVTVMGYSLLMRGFNLAYQAAAIGDGVLQWVWWTGAILLVWAWVSWLVHVVKLVRARRERMVKVLPGGTTPVLYKDKDFMKELALRGPTQYQIYDAKVKRVRARAMRGDPSAIAWCVANGHAEGIPGAITMAALGLDFIQHG